MTDSHAHLTNSPIAENLETVLNTFATNGGKHILNCSFNIQSAYELIKNRSVYDKIAPGIVRLAIGLHPEEFTSSSPDLSNITSPSYEFTRKQLNTFEQTLRDNINIISAIGETGLDYYWFFKTTDDSVSFTNKTIHEEIEMEKFSFIRHIELATKFDLPLSIHSREIKGHTECIEDSLKILVESGKGKAKGCMHSYTGDIKFIDDILDLGFAVGFNQIVTYKNAVDVRELVKKVPIEMILLETDCPLLPLRKPYVTEGVKYGYPVDIKVIASVVGQVKGLSTEDVLLQTDKNFERIFGK